VDSAQRRLLPLLVFRTQRRSFKPSKFDGFATLPSVAKKDWGGRGVSSQFVFYWSWAQCSLYTRCFNAAASIGSFS